MPRSITLADLARHIPSMIAALDAQGCWVRFNPAWLAFRGTTATQELALAATAIHPEDRPQAEEQLRQALHDPAPFSRRYRLRRHDNQFRWIEERGEPLLGKGGHLRGMILTAQDIDDQRDTLEQLQENHALYHRMFRNNQVIKLLIDPSDGTIVDANEAASAYYGYPRDRLLQLNISDINTLPPTAVAAEMQRAKNNEKTYFSFRHRLSSGEIRDVEVYSDPIALGSRTLLFSLIHDVTERTRAKRALELREEQLTTLVEATPDAIFFKNGEGHWLLINQAGLATMGMEGTDYLGKGDRDFAELYPESREAFLACVASDEKAWQVGTTSQVEEQVPQSDGTMGIFDVIKIPLFHPDGSRKGLVIIGRNVTDRVRAEERIRTSERRYRSIIDTSSEGFWAGDEKGVTVGVNQALCSMLGYHPDEIIGRHATLFATQEGSREIQNQLDEASQTQHRTYETTLQTKDGRPLFVRINATTLTAPGPEDPRSFAFITDLTELRAKEQELQLAARVFEYSLEGIMISDADQRIVVVNNAFTDITGYTAQEAIGQTSALLHSGHHDESFYQAMNQQLLEQGSWQGEIWHRRKSGEIYPEWLVVTVVRDDSGAITHYVGMFTDITARKESEIRLNYLANHDTLTRLPNRTFFLDRLDHAIAHARRHGHWLAVMFLDLDRFKVINDTLGHALGDMLLLEAGQRLRRIIREEDTVARLGGDEFVILVEEVIDTQATAAVAAKVLNIFADRFLVEGQEVFASTSIGISLYPDDGQDGQTLLRKADAAMYQAKEAGRNTYHFYSPDRHGTAYDRLTLENALRKALRGGELSLVYQPQVSGLDATLVGIEALARWNHPERGPIPPAHFIPMAEEAGLIIPIGRWVLHTACAQIRAWLDEGLDCPKVSVNLSARQFRDQGLKTIIAEALDAFEIPAHYLDLEITEGTLMQQAESTQHMLETLKGMGLTLSVDDFGTGYSSLSYLKRFPLDILKIDQSFVRDVDHDPEDSAIVTAIVAMAHSLKLTVVAEGVETAEQAAFLCSLGCDAMQGNHFHPPLSDLEITSLLRARGGLPPLCGD